MRIEVQEAQESAELLVFHMLALIDALRLRGVEDFTFVDLGWTWKGVS